MRRSQQPNKSEPLTCTQESEIDGTGWTGSRLCTLLLKPNDGTLHHHHRHSTVLLLRLRGRLDCMDLRRDMHFCDLCRLHKRAETVLTAIDGCLLRWTRTEPNESAQYAHLEIIECT
jgi:hypothetical protein